MSTTGGLSGLFAMLTRTLKDVAWLGMVLFGMHTASKLIWPSTGPVSGQKARAPQGLGPSSLPPRSTTPTSGAAVGLAGASAGSTAAPADEPVLDPELEVGYHCPCSDLRLVPCIPSLMLLCCAAGVSSSTDGSSDSASKGEQRAFESHKSWSLHRLAGTVGWLSEPACMVCNTGAREPHE